MQTLKEIIEAISDIEGVDKKDVMGLAVEFGTISKGGMSLLSAYEYDGKIIVDIGTAEDDEENLKMSGY